MTEQQDEHKPLGLTVDAIRIDGAIGQFQDPLFGGASKGEFVAVRLAGKDTTHLGVYLGDLPTMLGVRHQKEDNTLVISPGLGNPAMWVPSLKRVVFGYESWWRVISAPEDLKEISDADIDSVWYMQALKALGEQEVERNESHT